MLLFAPALKLRRRIIGDGIGVVDQSDELVQEFVVGRERVREGGPLDGSGDELPELLEGEVLGGPRAVALPVEEVRRIRKVDPEPLEVDELLQLPGVVRSVGASKHPCCWEESTGETADFDTDLSATHPDRLRLSQPFISTGTPVSERLLERYRSGTPLDGVPSLSSSIYHWQKNDDRYDFDSDPSGYFDENLIRQLLFAAGRMSPVRPARP